MSHFANIYPFINLRLNKDNALMLRSSNVIDINLTYCSIQALYMAHAGFGELPMKPLENSVTVSLATTANDALVQAFARLLPQLSANAAPLSKADLDEIIHAPGNHVFIARMAPEQRIVGTLTLVHFRVPTGIRAWIEDVVVDEQARGLKVGMALTRAAIAKSRELKARTLDLTSSPGRMSAHHLYESAGFAMRDTRVYRYQG